MKIYELLDLNEMRRAEDEGFIRYQYHSIEPLVIVNYTEKAQFANHWTEVTKTCRGLIYNSQTLDVVARPFPKFMNYGQPGAPEMSPYSRVAVTDKMDGSLGILYRKPSDGSLAIATRGSFHSEQAERATRMLQEKEYGKTFKPEPFLTYLFEIIYPENRIVVDYGDKEDLFLLGTVHMGRGDTFGPYGVFSYQWTGPRTTTYVCDTLAEALAMPERKNAEGIVVHFLDTDERVKIKQADYVALHRIVTGLNARTVWQYMVDGKKLSDLIETLPDEFHSWAVEVWDEINNLTLSVYEDVMAIWRHTRSEMAAAGEHTKKDYALRVKGHPFSSYLFLQWDGKNVYEAILSKLKPAADWTPRKVVTEDAA